LAPLEQRLRDRLATLSFPLDRAVALAELGCYLARIGDIESAEKIVSDLRSTVGMTDSRVAISVLLLEGLIRLFAGTGQKPLERVQRAMALSLSLGDQEILSRVSSWHAHLCFLAGQFEMMSDSISRVLSAGELAPRDSVSRCHTTLGCAYTILGDDRRANLSFDQSRQISIDFGDRATISAIIFNRVTHRAARFRYSSRRSLEQVMDDPFIDLEFISGVNLDAGTRNTAWADLSLAWRARILLLQGNSVAAESLLNGLGALPADFSNREDLQLIVDRARAKLASGNVAAAAALLQAISDVEVGKMDPDDRAIMLCIKQHSESALSKHQYFDDALQERIKDAEAAHEALLEGLAASLQRVEAFVR